MERWKGIKSPRINVHHKRITRPLRRKTAGVKILPMRLLHVCVDVVEEFRVRRKVHLRGVEHSVQGLSVKQLASG